MGTHVTRLVNRDFHHHAKNWLKNSVNKFKSQKKLQCPRKWNVWKFSLILSGPTGKVFFCKILIISCALEFHKKNRPYILQKTIFWLQNFGGLILVKIKFLWPHLKGNQNSFFSVAWTHFFLKSHKNVFIQ